MSQAVTLSCEHISKYFTVQRGFFAEKRKLTAVEDVCFTLKEGECLGLVGESGCGKSTLGRLISGLLPPSRGKILLEGKELPEASAVSWARGRIQMIFQDPYSSLNPRMTVAASVAEPLAAQGVPEGKRMAKAREMLARVGLEGAGARYPHEFSGGQRQRIAVARALITKPAVVVCDEPVSALDASVQAQILNLLCEMQELFAPAYLFISHDLNVVGYMCERIMVMYLGRMVEEGPKDALFAGPAHPYTEALLAAGTVQKVGKKKLLEGELPSPLDPPSGCPFHPRCERSQTICREKIPDWIELSPLWRVRCHFPGSSSL